MPLNWSDSTQSGLLIFTIDHQRFAIPAAQAREVVRAVAVTPLPEAPAVVAGVINVRGTVVPVIDFRKRFDLPDTPLEISDFFVLAWTNRRDVALRVSSVEGLRDVAADDIEDATRVARGVERIVGIARLPEGLVLIHDLERLLDATESEQLDTALEQMTVEDESRSRA